MAVTENVGGVTWQGTFVLLKLCWQMNLTPASARIDLRMAGKAVNQLFPLLGEKRNHAFKTLLQPVCCKL